jgi:hypothetical protein
MNIAEHGLKRNESAKWSSLMKYALAAAIFLVLGLATTSLAEDKIYTNDDLKPERSNFSNSSKYTLGALIRRADFNSSFSELQKYVYEKLKKIGSPENRIYLNPLSGGLTKEQVRQLWGTKIRGGLHEENESKSWIVDSVNYDIGVSLYFENNCLRGWQIYEQPLHSMPRRTNAVDYRKLMKRPYQDVPDSNKESLQPADKRKPFNDQEQVVVKISGCQTLQEALDGKPGKTDAEFPVLRHGRTIQEICETVGQGCRSCAESQSVTK